MDYTVPSTFTHGLCNISPNPKKSVHSIAESIIKATNESAQKGSTYLAPHKTAESPDIHQSKSGKASQMSASVKNSATKVPEKLMLFQPNTSQSNVSSGINFD